MAQPIPFTPPQRDPRAALFYKLENAPQEHAEALLAAYEVLQGLHDRGVLDLLRGGLGSGEKILEMLVEAGNTPESIRGIRNFIILTKLFGSLEPKLLEHLADAVPTALTKAKEEKPLGLLQLLGKFSNRDSRRILSVMARVLETLGKGLGKSS
jgi:uncharacterized protein YjgD (DUF1641 family)